MHKKNRVLGFTIIELMIAVAIIGILSALAVPAYQNYTIRAKVTEGLAYMSQYKTDVMEYYASHIVFLSISFFQPIQDNLKLFYRNAWIHQIQYWL